MLDPDTDPQHWCLEVQTTSSFVPTESNKKIEKIKLQEN